MTAGNGSLMRLAPIPIFYHARNEDPVALAGESSRTTHGAAVAVDACRFLCALIGGAFRGASKGGFHDPSDIAKIDFDNAASAVLALSRRERDWQRECRSRPDTRQRTERLLDTSVWSLQKRGGAAHQSSGATLPLRWADADSGRSDGVRITTHACCRLVRAHNAS